ncbi:MAG: hypothetical protein JXA74_03845, partial [Anaerolineae bacterium]|nr:hypothetical protein [Anaerolineae bacterium]
MSSDDARGLTIEQLEALVRLKQREIAEEKVTRFALAESQPPAICEAAKVWEAEAPRPARSPESWRGAEGRDRYFRSLAPLPLEGSAAHRPGDWSGAQEARASAGRPLDRARARLAPRSWRDGLLLAFELMALVGFVAVLGLSYLRLQALNREARALQRAALTRAIAPAATPWSSARQVAPVAQVEAGGVEP